MDAEGVAIGPASSEANSAAHGKRERGGSVRFSDDSPQRDHQHEATSPTTGQTRPHSTPSSAGFHASKARDDASSSGGSTDDSASSGSSSVGGAPKLFPLVGFLRLLLDQEKMLWERNELLLKSLKGEAKWSCVVAFLSAPTLYDAIP